MARRGVPTAQARPGTGQRGSSSSLLRRPSLVLTPPPARHRPAAPSTTPTRPRPNKPKREADSAAAVPSPGASRSLAQRATPALLLSCRRSRPWATASALAHFPRPHLLRHGSRVFRAMTTSGPWRCVPVPHLLRGRSSTDRCAGSAEGWAAGPAPSAPMHPLSGACLPVPGRSLTLWIPGNKRRGDPGCPNSPRTREEGLGWGEPCRLRAGIHAPRCTFPTPTPSPPSPPRGTHWAISFGPLCSCLLFCGGRRVSLSQGRVLTAFGWS